MVYDLIRVSEEFKRIIDEVRAKCMLNGKNIPTIADITKKIAKKINSEEIYKDEFE